MHGVTGLSLDVSRDTYQGYNRRDVEETEGRGVSVSTLQQAVPHWWSHAQAYNRRGVEETEGRGVAAFLFPCN